MLLPLASFRRVPFFSKKYHHHEDFIPATCRKSHQRFGYFSVGLLVRNIRGILRYTHRVTNAVCMPSKKKVRDSIGSDYRQQHVLPHKSLTDRSIIHACKRENFKLINIFVYFFIYISIYITITLFTTEHAFRSLLGGRIKAWKLLPCMPWSLTVTCSVVQTFLFIYLFCSLASRISRCRNLCSCSALKRLELATCWYYICRCSSLSIRFLVSACSH